MSQTYWVPNQPSESLSAERDTSDAFEDSQDNNPPQWPPRGDLPLPVQNDSSLSWNPGFSPRTLGHSLTLILLEGTVKGFSFTQLCSPPISGHICLLGLLQQATRMLLEVQALGARERKGSRVVEPRGSGEDIVDVNINEFLNELLRVNLIRLSREKVTVTFAALNVWHVLWGKKWEMSIAVLRWRDWISILNQF